ncbi:PREDICTED: pentatricopeptide repeat-containing protein At5g48910-like [Lupinus angustifolius]|uniref:pentatricopeptide repeat-containing protein At5g48910-like n=1 Tax=Lupinus angustifolius TaxID=3871 RepID=UPI00092FCDE0|nr:PREDICTED: pentatricopeptide repeat-containing protein At5g48910-like [Lupinus angustifolius]XP_019464797.1 PREDICTED: pentatricopeptide repeat-containing protein At5g48910-like [Lupinus angustifolius]
MNSLMMNPSIAPSHPQLQVPHIRLCKNIRELKQVHAFFIKTAQTHNPNVATELLKLAATSDFRDTDYALSLFDQMPEPNCFAWNTLIRSYSESKDRPIDALLLFCKMVSDGIVEPNGFTFPSVLKACSVVARLEEGKQVHGLVVKFGLGDDEFVVTNLLRMYVMCGEMEDAHVLFYRNVNGIDDMKRMVRDKRKQEGDVVMCNVMIDGYVRLGKLKAAREFFDKMHQRSVVSWNAIISGYAQNGFFVEAVEMFHKMQMGDVSPNRVTLVSVLPAISRLGALELGKWVHLYAEKNKVQIDDVLGSALVDMYAKCGNIEKAIQVFERLPKHNVITWNAIIGGLAMHGRSNDLFKFFSRMKRSGVTPSDVTYIALLSACSHTGLVDEGRSFFNHMVNVIGLEPRVEHYGCMVDLLGRAGYLEEAEQLISNMPIRSDDVIWKALLGACKMHKNIEIGRRAAEVLMQLAPHDSGAYVALSNMYASAGDWDAVAEVRLMMKDMNIRKDPGCSWIEMDGIIHEFLVEDDSHPRAKDIHLMLEEISKKLNLEGYRLDITQVLLKMDDKNKENVLHYHSEKIAVAFGLISTSPNTPLQIVKNLRICEDCHSSMKLISKIYERRITVRDRKRFHHFEHGSCSCMDYW